MQFQAIPVPKKRLQQKTSPLIEWLGYTGIRFVLYVVNLTFVKIFDLKR